MNYVLDTNIITALMKGNQIIKEKLQTVIIGGGTIFINGISYYEIKRGLLSANATKKLKDFAEICNSLKSLLLDNINIFDKASEIYALLKQKGELIQDADILIGALVLTKNYICVSSNTQHFSRINGLRLENWLR